jgi:O-antigen ligase
MNKITQKSALLFLIFLPIIPVFSYLSFLILIFCFFYAHKIKRIPLNSFAYILLVTVFLSCIFSSYKLISFGAFGLFICYFLGYLIFANTKFEEEKIINAIILSGIGLTVIGVIMYFTKSKFVFEYKFVSLKLLPRASTLGNPNRFAKYLVLITPFAFSILLFKNKLKSKFLPILFIPLSFLSLWITRALAGMLATYIAILIVLWNKNKAVVIGIFILGTSLLALKHKKIQSLTTTCSTQRRINTIKYTVPKILKLNPITGCGLGTYKEVSKRYYEEKIPLLYYHAHNMYAHYLCETGVIGIFTFFLFIGMFFYYNIKYLNLKWLTIGGISSISGLLIHGIAETCIDYFQIGLFFFVIIGIVTSANQNVGKTSQP